MKKALRLISFILCLVMLSGCITVSAEGSFDKIKTDYLAYLIAQNEDNSKYTADDILIQDNYGNHSGYDIVVMGVAGQLVSPVTGSITIAGITFTFGYAADIETFYAYKEGEFIHVSDAYDAALLTKTDIYNIALEKGDIRLPEYRELWTDGNITFTLEETTATLYVGGEGRTDDYEEMYIVGGLGLESYSPVGGNSFIKHVVVDEGITYLGENIFSQCSAIETVELPDTLEEIGDKCFDRCNAITHVIFPEGIKRIGNFCFGSANLKALTFYGNAPKTKEYSILKYFDGTAYYPDGNPTWTEEYMSKYSSNITWESWSAPKIKNASNRFDDVSNNAWYTDAVQYVYDREMMVGTAFNAFSPNTAMTRAQVVQVLFNLSGESKEKYTGESRFTDVSSSAWYTPAINWADKNMITSGVGFDRFAPDQLVSRGELVTFLLNFAGELGCTLSPETADLTVYDDYREVGNWCYNGMAWAVHEGIISGMTETTLAPKVTANRAQASRMLMKYYEYLGRTRPVLCEIEQTIADYVRENGTHGIGYGEYKYTIKQDDKMFSVRCESYGFIKFSYNTSTRAGGSPGQGSYHESLSFCIEGLADEYDYYYHNTCDSYLITSRGVLTSEGFVESEFENKREYPTDEEAYALRDTAMAELTAFVEQILNEMGLTTADLFLSE